MWLDSSSTYVAPWSKQNQKDDLRDLYFLPHEMHSNSHKNLTLQSLHMSKVVLPNLAASNFDCCIVDFWQSFLI